MYSNDIQFESIQDFCAHIDTEVTENEGIVVSVVGKYREVCSIFDEFMPYSDMWINSIHIESPDFRGYTDEYIVSLECFEGTIALSCKPLKSGGRYTLLHGDVIYLFDNCSSKLIPICDGIETYFVSIGDEDFLYNEDDDDCLCDFEDGDDRECTVNITVNLDTDNTEFIFW